MFVEIDVLTYFQTGEAVDVDSELATILSCSRYKEEFDFKPSSRTDITAPTQQVNMNPAVVQILLHLHNR